MTTFYLDPINGNDANDGTTFANRWKTLTNGATAVRIAPGDTIRVIASPDPSSVGSATWTDNRSSVALAAACTAVIDNCDAAWTASANVTATAAAANRKEGTNCVSLAVATAFTTGVVAYKATGLLDLSAYQQISFWIRSNIGHAAGTLRVDLCSDTAGATPVHSFTIQRAFNAGTWMVCVFDNGAALSNSIQSIALTALSDPGTPTILLDNIIACKAPSAADSLTHLSLIGKNTAGEPEWYPIMSINGTDVQLGGVSSAILSSAASTPQPYRGTTESVTTYKFDPLTPAPTDTTPAYSSFTLQESGAVATPFTLSGGWNRTDMSTQTGASWLGGSHWHASLINLSSRTDWVLRKIGIAHATTNSVQWATNADRMDIQLEGVVGCGSITASQSGFGMSTAMANAKVDLGNVVMCPNGVRFTGQNVDLAFRRILGMWGNGYGLVPDNQGGLWRITMASGGTIDNGPVTASGVKWLTGHVGRTFFNANGGAVGTNMGSGVLLDGVGSGGFTMLDVTVAGSTPFQASSAQPYDFVPAKDTSGVWSQNSRYYTFTQATDQRNTASGYSWKFIGTTGVATIWNTTYRRWMQPIARKAVTAGVTYTITCWVYRDHSSYVPGIMVLGGIVDGIASDVVGEAAGAINTWEQVSINVTPTETTVLEIFACLYATVAAVHNCWWDDLSIA